MGDEFYKWDFFLAHAAGDKDSAESLYALLAPKARTFLDTKCLMLGDDWDTQLPAAQKASLITVVLVSSNTQKAYYQREEIAAAIALAREDAQAHRVVPLYLDATASQSGNMPYGLRGKHGLQFTDELTLESAAQRLVSTLDQLKQAAASPRAAPAPVAQPSIDARPERQSRQRVKSWIVAAALAALVAVAAIVWRTWPQERRSPSVLVEIDRAFEQLIEVRVDLFAKPAQGPEELLGTWTRPAETRAEGRGYAVLFEGSGYDPEAIEREIAGPIGASESDEKNSVFARLKPTKPIDSMAPQDLSAKLVALPGTAGGEEQVLAQSHVTVSDSPLLRIRIQ